MTTILPSLPQPPKKRVIIQSPSNSASGATAGQAAGASGGPIQAIRAISEIPSRAADGERRGNQGSDFYRYRNDSELPYQQRRANAVYVGIQAASLETVESGDARLLPKIDLYA